tara:strand:- start:88 stop:552 length:465 start_codon:yes stop_codon:yes gene_type:complete
MKYIFLAVLIFFSFRAHSNTKIWIFENEIDLPENCTFYYRDDKSFNFSCRNENEEYSDGISIGFQAKSNLSIAELKQRLKEMPDESDMKFVSQNSKKIGDLTHTVVLSKLVGFDFYGYFICTNNLNNKCLELTSGSYEKIHFIVQQLGNEVLEP